MRHRKTTLPSYWYRGAHGDPVPVFDDDSIVIVLNEDGSVTWQQISDAQREEAEDARS